MRWAMLIFVAACTRSNPEVCCASAEDCASLGVAPADHTCPARTVCSAEHACESVQCTVDDDCTAPTGKCAADHTCVACLDDMDCSGGAPHCLDGMACVECTSSANCMEPTATCDLGTYSCRGCIADAECPSTVCDTSSGACVAAGDVLYASPDGSATAACDQQHPCAIAHAISLADASHEVVRALPGTYTATLVAAAKTISLYADGATFLAPGSQLAIQVNDGGHFTGRGFSATSSASVPVACYSNSSTSSARSLALVNAKLDGQIPLSSNDCTVSIVGSTLTSHSGSIAEPAIQLAGSTAVIDRAVLDGPSGIGISATGASTFAVTNSVFANQTGGAISLDATSSGSVSFSTFYRSHLACVKGSITVDSAIFSDGGLGGSGSPDSVEDGAVCAFKYSLFVPQQVVPTGTKNLGNLDPRLVDPSHGNFAPMANSPAIDAGDPSASPPVDLLGTHRPQGAGSDIGAVEFVH